MNNPLYYIWLYRALRRSRFTRIETRKIVRQRLAQAST
jgi:hypothetical protein